MSQVTSYTNEDNEQRHQERLLSLDQERFKRYIQRLIEGQLINQGNCSDELVITAFLNAYKALNPDFRIDDSYMLQTYKSLTDELLIYADSYYKYSQLQDIYQKALREVYPDSVPVLDTIEKGKLYNHDYELANIPLIFNAQKILVHLTPCIGLGSVHDTHNVLDGALYEDFHQFAQEHDMPNLLNFLDVAEEISSTNEELFALTHKRLIENSTFDWDKSLSRIASAKNIEDFKEELNYFSYDVAQIPSHTNILHNAWFTFTNIAECKHIIELISIYSRLDINPNYQYIDDEHSCPEPFATLKPSHPDDYLYFSHDRLNKLDILKFNTTNGEREIVGLQLINIELIYLYHKLTGSRTIPSWLILDFSAPDTNRLNS